MKFLHAADLHLDSPMRGLEAYEGAPIERLRGATRRALENTVRLAISERVDFLLIAGDIYDGDWPDYGTGMFFAGRMSELREAGIRVFLISGNHDAASEITRRLPLPENVYRLSDTRPETVCFEECGVAIHGRGFAQRAAPDDFSAAYPPALKGYLNLGLLHTSADGRPGHAPYAPCTVDGLKGRGYDYWALGHVHTHEFLWRPNPWIVYPGVLQGRNIREAGPKGCVLVEAQDGQITRVEPRAVDVLRWTVCPVDASTAEDGDAVVERARDEIRAACDAAGGRAVAVRVIVEGLSPAHDALGRRREHWVHAIRAMAGDVSGGLAWVEQVQFRTESPQARPASPATPRWLEGAAGSLRRAVETLPAEAGDDGLFGELADLQKKLQSDLGRDFADLDFDLTAPEMRGQLLQDVQRLLLARFCAEEEP